MLDSQHTEKVIAEQSSGRASTIYSNIFIEILEELVPFSDLDKNKSINSQKVVLSWLFFINIKTYILELFL